MNKTLDTPGPICYSKPMFLRISIVLTILVLAGCASAPTPSVPPVQEITAKQPIEKQIKELVTQLSSQDRYERARAIDSLLAQDAKEAIPDITKLLQDNDRLVRASAVGALGILKAKEAIPEIIRLLQDDSLMVRGSAVEALARLDAREAVPELIKVLNDKDDLGRGFTAIVLVELGAKDKVPTKSIEDIKLFLKSRGGDSATRARAALKELGVEERERSPERSIGEVPEEKK